jgi:CRISPR-associated endonuclease/helicase Cas3
VSFDDYFKACSGKESARPYQRDLALGRWPETLVVPTGFGKTAAVLAAWLWKVAAKKDTETPRRLIYCLPMRTLVEQTEVAAKRWVDETRKVFSDLDVSLDVLIGGRNDEPQGVPGWISNPDRPAIVIGTQDLLISAALMRGYGTSRYRWPVDFALLHNDALWVFDEVQLTGATLLTSVQLEAFRRGFGTGRESRTLWMSATLDPAWLKTVDFSPADPYRPHDLSVDDLAQAAHLWTARKTLHAFDLPAHDIVGKEGLGAYAAALATKARAVTKPGTNTIVFLNTVARAQAVYDALSKISDGVELLLAHSRFRAAERAGLLKKLDENLPTAGRIVVATQALEAGVDVTSATMFTEIAPWSSLVQRFGRCNRYGECAETGADVFWIDLPDDDKAARPYDPPDFDEARKKLATLSACGPADLAAIRPSKPSRGAVIRKRDLFDLFDTDPDLSGFDLDISPYVRDADDTDVRLFWRPVETDAPPSDAAEPAREELCPAPIGGAKLLLERKGVRAWLWNALTKEWQTVKKNEVFPGLVIWIDSAAGGYDPERGFDAAAKRPVDPISGSGAPEPEPAVDMNGDRDAHTSEVRVSLAKHSAHVRDKVIELAETFALSQAERTLLAEAALWHDRGKAHAAFVALTTFALTDGVSPPLAKWPNVKGEKHPGGARKYFRHELASALAYLNHHDWAPEASLGAYLIAAHHGKIRMRLRALPKEEQPVDGRLFARGVWDGDMLPETLLGDEVVPETRLDLDLMKLGDGRCGPSWSARTQRLLKDLGPFRLAWLEALLRIADWRASAAEEKANHDDL